MAVNATAIWRVRPSGNNANGGGYDAGIASPGTDYSQQNAPQVTFDGVTVAAHTSGITTTIILTGYTVAATDVANCVQISGGTNFTTGFYFIVSVNVGLNTWTLDRNATTGAGTGMTGRMGGGWADFWTNTTTSGQLVPGNTVYILGSGTPNPASYTYDYTASARFTAANGDSTNGTIVFLNDPATPGYKAPPDTTGGMPCIKCPNDVFFYGNGPVVQFVQLGGLWFVASGATNGNYGVLANANNVAVIGCVLDQFGFDYAFTGNGQNSYDYMMDGCEIFSSVAPGSAGSNIAVGGYYFTIVGCNIHDLVGGPAITGLGSGHVQNCLIAKCRGGGIKLDSGNGVYAIINNTIDGNSGHGIEITGQGMLCQSKIMNNIISNHTGAGKYGLTVDAGTTAQNDRVKHFVDYNTYYNNTTDLNAISYGAHDTHGGSNPYVGQSTENYTLA